VSAGEATRVATGHTRDDQAETVMLRLLRGAGAGGLAGILPVRDQVIARPLLRLDRTQLRSWLQEQGQPWREDATNLDLHYSRNRMRAQALPRLQAEFNPALVARLCALAEVQRGEEAFWVDYLDPLLRACGQPLAPGLRLPAEVLRALPLAVRRRLLRAAVAQVQGHLRQVGFDMIEELLDWLDLPGTRPRVRRLGGLECRVSRAGIEIRWRAEV
ncbi:MAG: ATP-binding protein, partial [Terriglobales bacterium]